MTSLLALPKDLEEYSSSPPIYWLTSTADVVSKDDEHLNTVWRGMVRQTNEAEPCLQMALKYLGTSSIKISIELACGLAALALKLPVPRPALVICSREDLPTLPTSAIGEKLLVFGSQNVPEDTFMMTMRRNDPAAAEYVWKKVCDDPVGRQGAAWDELIANSDRHHLNIIFDGKWWLFDHDKAIPPASDSAKLATLGNKNQFPEFALKVNQLAAQMLERRPNDHNILTQSKDFEKLKARLDALMHKTNNWRNQISDQRIRNIFQDTAYLIGLIASRLPALAMHLQSRIGVKKDGDSLWT